MPVNLPSTFAAANGSRFEGADQSDTQEMLHSLIADIRIPADFPKLAMLLHIPRIHIHY